ncbi:MAG: ATP-dependent phosphofructokinase / diphosphate-dependent phosphofructokinase [Clostridiales bacterium]|nr:ATP-dependent phosphofructokinase / diphosphate-dependent phosphofructokinase [Clostridiales bacterium]
MKQRNCMIGQSGGPTTAINASLAGVIKEAMDSLVFQTIYGAVYGVEGLLNGNYIKLSSIFNDTQLLETLKLSPSMYLGSCRYKLPPLPKNKDTKISEYEAIFSLLNALSITDFFYIGGNDSMDSVMKLTSYAALHQIPIQFIGIPKTIDNDLYGTDHTPGFGSAAKFVATSMLEIIHDSMFYNTDSVTIVEIMGRNAGWLTAAASLARSEGQAAPHLIYLPEVPFDVASFLGEIKELRKTTQNIIIAVSEGIHDKDGNFIDDGILDMGEENNTVSHKTDAFGHVIHEGTGKSLERLVKNTFGCKCRSIELNVLQRCALHISSKTDLEEAFWIGQAAVKASLSGASGVMMTLKRLSSSDGSYQTEIETISINEIANVEKKVPLSWISKSGTDITEEFYEYLLPLIEGEVTTHYHNGLPSYIDVCHLK